MEAENITIASIDAGNRVAPHELYLMGDGDTRYGRSSDVVVGDEEGISDGTEHPNLMANVGQIRPSGGLDFTDDLESLGHLQMVLPAERRVLVARAAMRSALGEESGAK